MVKCYVDWFISVRDMTSSYDTVTLCLSMDFNGMAFNDGKVLRGLIHSYVWRDRFIWEVNIVSLHRFHERGKVLCRMMTQWLLSTRDMTDSYVKVIWRLFMDFNGVVKCDVKWCIPTSDVTYWYIMRIACPLQRCGKVSCEMIRLYFRRDLLIYHRIIDISWELRVVFMGCHR